jgi:hypothetical protein
MPTVEDTIEARLPETPAGAAARWFMGWARRRGQGLTLLETQEALEVGDDFDFDQYRDGFGWVADRLGPTFVVESLDASDPFSIDAVLVGDGGRRWQWGLQVSDEAPHRITAHPLRRALPTGVEIRPARPDDGTALGDVARRAPLRLTDSMVVVDPGHDYFAACRLMGDSAITFVATHEGTPIGVHCGVRYPVRFLGEVRTCCLIAHSRLLPEHSGGGIWGRLNDSVYDHFRAAGGWDIPLAYVRPDNASAQRLGGAEARWTTHPFRAVIDCAANADADAVEVGRRAAPTDARHIVTLLNDFHGAEELFLPYTEDSLAERLTRAADLYTWKDLRVTDSAVVGVWARGERHTRTPDEGEPTSSVRAAVLDFGCAPGGEDELEALLRAACADLRRAGITHLGVFSSPASPASDRLRSLAAFVEEYDLMPPGHPEPPTVASSGVYVDPIYF